MNNMPLLRIAWRFDLVRLKDSMSDINTNTAMLDSITRKVSSGQRTASHQMSGRPGRLLH